MSLDVGVPPELKGDADLDGDHDFDDIPPFVAILWGAPINGGLQSVPEPSSLLLTVFAAGNRSRRAEEGTTNSTNLHE